MWKLTICYSKGYFSHSFKKARQASEYFEYRQTWTFLYHYWFTFLLNLILSNFSIGLSKAVLFYLFPCPCPSIKNFFTLILSLMYPILLLFLTVIWFITFSCCWSFCMVKKVYSPSLSVEVVCFVMLFKPYRCCILVMVLLIICYLL